jgi:hypothetical protein
MVVPHSLCAEVDIAAPFLDMHLLVDPGLAPLQVGVTPGWPYAYMRQSLRYAYLRPICCHAYAWVVEAVE